MRIIFFLSLLTISSLYSLELKVSYGKHNSAPYTFIEENELTGGIIKDIFDEIGLRLNIEIIYIETPKNRQVEFIKSGRIDVLPIMNPQWIEEENLLSWSPVILRENNVFVIRKDNFIVIESHRDLYGRRIGCIKGYFYKGLNVFFRDETITRVDNSNLLSNLKMLEAGRIDAVINSDIVLKYQLRNRENLMVSDFISASYNIHFGYSKKSAIPDELINKTLSKLLDEGFINKRVKYYLEAD